MLFFFWILVTCGDGSTQKSCGECPKPTSDDDGNCESANGDCVVKKFTTALNPLIFGNPRQEEFFCTSKYLNCINKVHNFFLLLFLLSICTGILGNFDILQFEISSLMNWIFFLDWKKLVIFPSSKFQTAFFSNFLS